MVLLSRYLSFVPQHIFGSDNTGKINVLFTQFKKNVFHDLWIKPIASPAFF